MAFLLLKLIGIFIRVDFLPGLILLSAGILVVVLVVGYYCNYYMEAELQLRRFISLL
jgi:NADH:ubiquinone oxidoreductase subunit 5 (subunit L)/multisubunit Na+/H+ antiporter MnhA subunit